MTHDTTLDVSDVYDSLTLAQGEMAALLDILASAIASGSNLSHLSSYVSAMIGQQDKIDARASALWDAMNAEKESVAKSPWIWSGTEPPPVGVQILCLDPFHEGNLEGVEVANYNHDTSCLDGHFWWMRIPMLGSMDGKEVIHAD